jgi:hypothetical protein
MSPRDINDILREDGEAAARVFRDSAKRFKPPPSPNGKSAASSVTLDRTSLYRNP